MKRYLTLFFVLLVAVACATQEQVMDSQPVDIDALEYPELNPYQIPEIETFELDNGIKFYLVEDDEVPLINLNMIVRAGSFMDPADKVGLASITANVIRNGGSEAYPEDDLNQMLEDRAARMEFGMGLTSGSASLNALKEDFVELLPVMVDVMMNPLLPQEKIDLAITQRRSSIMRRNDEAQQVGFREFGKLIYGPDSPQARSVELYTLSEITRDDLVNFHSRAFTGKNLKIGLVGDFKADEMKAILEEIFSEVPAGEKNDLDFPEVDYDFEPGIYFIDKRDVNQSVVLMGHIGGLRDNPDYAALQAMNEVLSGGFSGRLFQNVRSDQGLAYSVFGSYGSNALYPGQFFAGIFTRSSATGDAISAVRREMEKLQEEPVSQQELNDTRDAILNSLVFRYDSRARVLRERMNNEYLGLPADAFESYIEELRELTPANIQRVAREYMRPSDMKILVVGHGGELGDQLEQFGDVQEVDITIRSTPPGEDEEILAGDADAGNEWLGRMADAVLVEGDLDGMFLQEGSVDVVTPMGNMTMGRKESINFKDDIYRIELLNTPQGDITFNIEGNQGTVSAGGQEFPMQGPQVQQQKGEYLTHYIHVLLHRDEYTAEVMGQEEIDGVETVVLRLRGDRTLTYYVDQSSGLPVKMAYNEFNPQAGGEVEVSMLYSDWNIKDGVAVAYNVKSLVAGEEQATITINSHSVE